MDIIKGKTWTFGENIDTDVIIPGRYLRTFNPQDLADHVLSTFSSLEEKALAVSLKNAADATLAIIDKGVPEAANKFNGSHP